jgi:hypothetical protein
MQMRYIHPIRGDYIAKSGKISPVCTKYKHENGRNIINIKIKNAAVYSLVEQRKEK